MKDVIIIGAGIAGLSAGFELYKNAIDFQILETSSRAGGCIESLSIDDFLIETGPNTFSSSAKEVMGLVKELELEDSLLEGSHEARRKRYVSQNGKLVEVPSGLIEFFKSDLISKDGKMTLLEELFIKREEKEESVEDFVERRFGREILKNLIQPFLNGVFAGDVQKLSANAVFPKLKNLESRYKSVLIGSILSGDFRSSFKKLNLYSFKNGMEVLPNTLYEKIKSKTTLNVKDIDITKAKDFFVVNFKANNKTINYTANSVLFAIPAHRMNEFAYLLPEEHRNCFSIEYAPIAVINQVIEKSKLREPVGFGFLCTREPHRKLLGTIWTSSIFPDRSKEDKALFTSYAGGAHYKKVSDLTKDEIKTLVSKELSEIMNISDPDSIKTLNIKIHPHAIPQYNLGHLDKVSSMENIMESNSGIFFTGNYLKGVSLNDTIKTSKEVVEKIKDFLHKIKLKEKELMLSVTNT